MGTELKARPSNLRTLMASFLGAVVMLFGLLVLLFLLALGTQIGVTQFLFRLVCGFWFFLQTNVPLISVNAATWIPGVVALLLAVAGLHFFLRPWAVKSGRRWPLGNSVALAAVIPMLFVIAFLVPGILLQTGELAAMPRWFHRESARGSSNAIRMVKDHWMAAMLYADEHGGNFPGTLAELEATGKAGYLAEAGGRGRHYWDRDLPREPVIYLGSGFTDASDPTLPLLISPPFPGPDGMQRCVGTMDGGTMVILADDADLWIQRSLEARQAALGTAPPSP